MKGPYAYVVGVATCFGLWPIIGRLGGVSNAWFPALICAGGLAVTLPSALREGLPLNKGVLIVLLAGLVNGLGMRWFNTIVNWKGQDFARFQTMILVLMTLITVVAAALVLHEPITAKKLIGVALACGAIWCLT